MTLAGGCDPDQVDHDNSAKAAHIGLKAQLKARRGTYVFIPHDEELEFRNDFSKIPLEQAPFFLCGSIPKVRHEGIEPEEWDRGGAMASYSAGSEVADLRQFTREAGRMRRGRKRQNDYGLEVEDDEDLPAPPPPGKWVERDLKIEQVLWDSYRETLLGVREAAKHIKRWGTGAEGRVQWKNTPISVQTVLDEGEADATLLDSITPETAAAMEDPPQTGMPVKKKKTKLPHDLRRYTVNSHPALARAMAKVLDGGDTQEVMEFMNRTLPSVIRRFEKVTGRLVIGASIHWDSNMPHWNLWHTGLEKVLYRKGTGKDRERFRRTAMNLGSSGPGLRAWRRVELAYKRLGREFCQYTAAELRKEEVRLMKAQGRMPGDWAINEVADTELERLLVDSGYENEVEQAFREFVDNEDARYAAGMAGRLALEDRRELVERLARVGELQEQNENLSAAREKIAVELEHTNEERDGLRGQVAGLQQAVAKEKSYREKAESELESGLGDFDQLRVQMEADYNEVCAERDLLQVEKDKLVNEVLVQKEEVSRAHGLLTTLKDLFGNIMMHSEVVAAMKRILLVHNALNVACQALTGKSLEEMELILRNAEYGIPQELGNTSPDGSREQPPSELSGDTPGSLGS